MSHCCFVFISLMISYKILIKNIQKIKKIPLTPPLLSGLSNSSLKFLPVSHPLKIILSQLSNFLGSKRSCRLISREQAEKPRAVSIITGMSRKQLIWSILTREISKMSRIWTETLSFFLHFRICRCLILPLIMPVIVLM